MWNSTYTDKSSQYGYENVIKFLFDFSTGITDSGYIALSLNYNYLEITKTNIKLISLASGDTL